MRKKLKALGSYIFAGGFTLGVRKHFDVVAHLEGNPYGVKTFRENFPHVPVHVGAEKWPLDEYRGVDFVYSNPPCAVWSTLGKTSTTGAPWDRDPRVKCVRDVFRLLEELEPAVWCWESVPRAYSAGRELVAELSSRARERGYAVSYVLHNAMYLGSYQNRRRFFLVAHRVDLPWRCSFRPPLTALEALERYRGNGDERTMDNVRKPHFTKSLMRWTPPGWPMRRAFEVYRERWPERARRMGTPGFGHRKLYTDRPSFPVLGWMLIHPTKHRPLTVGEMAHLVGFPQTYRWESRSPTAIAALLARGVAPGVGRWLARIVRAGIEAGEPPRSPVQEVNFLEPPGRIETL